MKKVLITGITGFAGSHLADFLLLNTGVQVYGICRWRSKLDNIEHIKDKINLLECDIRDASSVRKVIDQVRPDYIFHLAAQSYVYTSWHAPAETLSTNILGELNIFEAVRELKLSSRIQIAGSSEEYGLVKPDEIPIEEDTPLRPLSPYAVSKVAQDMLAYQYYQSYRMEIVRTRAFNHSGPRRGEVFVCSNFAKQIVEIEKGIKKPIIKVGNLDAVRDFTDVRDTVRGYWLALEEGKSGEVYNICSGKGWDISKVLSYLLKQTKVQITIEKDPSRLRPSDVPILIGDNSKFIAETGWYPQIAFEQTLLDLLKFWRERIKNEQTIRVLQEH